MLVAGYLALIIGFGCLGIIRANQIKKRPQEIREMINALALLDTEIYWGATPLPDAFRVLKERTGPPWQAFFASLEEKIRAGENASQAWKKSIEMHRRKTCLTDDDWLVISGISQGLGRSDRNEQHKQLELVQRHLAGVDEKARQQAESRAKMWSYLGFLGGIAAVIMIM
ncbi:MULTISPECIES: stage III sporulation protein AB [unclassified Dehalobacter]|uniref:stage III sporulation protein AB n=1 Tax=unclassified Dehalobacter TaxID=2635733 RepID=UPI000E6BFE1B|nr:MULTISPECIES: stage III sporulation protein AB [unclassified Dehalobacter]RJE48376.1 stage III sporulation protein AB [Dehalobacter sp. MCB1]TCX50445.1 stage III sporulation protein AB [Dehalobacter sp. 14DCB1]TCX52315.1 stage III sporulation protein AB [Dehalobacter sp. 12DCB1]